MALDSNEQEVMQDSFQDVEELHRKQQWADILSELHAAPISTLLRAYFTELEERPPSWDTRTFIEGIKRFANLWGSERVEYFKNKLLGLHKPNSFTKAFNETNAQQPITALDQGFRLQCPPTWSRELRDRRWVLIYQKEAPLSQGLNELIQGPTTLDCGMFSQLLIWMAIRYLLGDKLFDNLFKFKKGQFILTQSWHQPMNEDGSKGTLLYYFYDDPRETTTEPLESEPSLETKTVYNHPAILAKHPGGDRLETVNRIEGYNILFDPELPQNIMTDAQLEQHLRRTYDAPQGPADFEKLEYYRECPEDVPSFGDFPHKSAGTIAEEAEAFATSTMSDEQWEASRNIRQWLARGLHRVLNFPRLIRCLKNAEEAYLDGEYDDVLHASKSAQKRDRLNAIHARVVAGLRMV